MSLRVALVGYGAVAAVHASQLETHDEADAVAVYGPSREKAEEFASRHQVAHAAGSLEAALKMAEVALICSPSSLHFEQARASLNCGCHTLVELPAVVNVGQADLLVQLAKSRRLRLSCAHTSRYLVPFQRIHAAVEKNELGQMRQIEYLRHHILSKRSWPDDALLHHSQHPLDLMLTWFNHFHPLSCSVLPLEGEARNVSLLGRLESGAPVSISISYDSRLPQTRMVIVGSQATAETDGFSFIRSSLEHLEGEFDEQKSYHGAIRRQDLDFFAACRGESQAVPWSETRRLTGLVSDFRKMRMSSGVL